MRSETSSVEAYFCNVMTGDVNCQGTQLTSTCNKECLITPNQHFPSRISDFGYGSQHSGRHKGFAQQ